MSEDSVSGGVEELLALPLHGGKPDPTRLAAFCRPWLETPWLANLDAIKLTGSNGKGSVAAMTAAILEAAGVRVGLYTSPHLVDFRERIRTGGMNADAMIRSEDLEKTLADVGRLAPRPISTLSFFEAATAVALAYFCETQPDVVIAEAGLGGRFDPVRLFSGRRAALVSIDLEHTAILGNTLETIAWDKAHLVNEGGVLFLGSDIPASVSEIVHDVCRQRGATTQESTCRVEKIQYREGRMTVDLSFREQYWQDVDVALAGDHQARNLALAVTLAVDWLAEHRLAEHRPGLTAERLESFVRQGLGNVQWPCRLERIADDPPVWVDAAHTPRAMQALAGSVRQLLGDRVVLLTGASQDKKPDVLLPPLLDLAAHVVVSRAQHRGMNVDDVTRAVVEHAPELPCVTEEDLASALDMTRRVATREGLSVLVAGGLFLAAEARRLI